MSLSSLYSDLLSILIAASLQDLHLYLGLPLAEPDLT